MGDTAPIESALRTAIAAHPDGVQAGPKALLNVLQETDATFAAVGFQKFKKLFAKVKAELQKEEEERKAEALKPKIGSKENCPGRHGLVRFLTDHTSFCCDTCRCYVTQGAAMWGCRSCDWDVCEGRCHPQEATLESLQQSCETLEKRLERALSIHGEADAVRSDPTEKGDDTQQSANAAVKPDLKTELALLEADVHRIEKTVDSTSASDLASRSLLTMQADDARAQKKALLSRTEKLLADIENVFRELKAAPRARA